MDAWGGINSGTTIPTNRTRRRHVTEKDANQQDSPTPEADSKLDTPPTGQEVDPHDTPDEQEAQEPDLGDAG